MGTVGARRVGPVAPHPQRANARTAQVRTSWGQRLTRIDKGAGDFATAADAEADRSILGVIHAARPEDAVFGEERGSPSATGATRQWLVDPLRDTLNQVVGNMLVAVNVRARVPFHVTYRLNPSVRHSWPSGRMASAS
ncbi:hypothetical protein J0695_18275 [Streptomyces beijiangensis]|uniref:Uncharacterized protein n=1 Tax=Streptomyces beijiangensis TaxID=163361 RepID=A0A939JF40_9ACTN|nr:hypothetical protein [Streptomyces beijiangensis]